MREALNVSGVVLSASPVGEYDKRVVLLTKERGKITAFARRARRPGSELMAATNPFVFAVFTVYEGKNAYTLSQAEVHGYFMELAARQPEVYYGFYFLEFADYYGHEYTEESEMVDLLYVAFRALLRGDAGVHLIRAAFEIRALYLHGEYALQKDEELSGSARLAVQHILSSPAPRLFAFAVTPPVLGELTRTARRQIDRCVDRKFRSLPLLEKMDKT